MKNKLLVLTLAFAMMLSFMPMASFAASDHDDTHYTYEIYIWDDDADCEHVDNEYHRVTGTGEVEVWCEDCEMVVDSYEIEADGKKFSMITRKKDTAKPVIIIAPIFPKKRQWNIGGKKMMLPAPL